MRQRFDVTENLKKIYKILGIKQALGYAFVDWMWGLCRGRPCSLCKKNEPNE